MRDEPRRHLRAIDACNQRGGRMLSIVDLVRAGTVELPLAAWLMRKISAGTPYVVGANPGGAGKTTVMCALLNFVPAEAELVAAESLSRVLDARRGDWLLCHEVGRGRYFAYLWARPSRSSFAPRAKESPLRRTCTRTPSRRPGRPWSARAASRRRISSAPSTCS